MKKEISFFKFLLAISCFAIIFTSFYFEINNVRFFNTPNYLFTSEDNSSSDFNLINITSDTTGPTITDITQDPITVTEVDIVTIDCTVIDESGIQSVTLFYYIIEYDLELNNVSMNHVTGDIYRATIGPFAYDDWVGYYIEAVDNYQNLNSTIDNHDFDNVFNVISSDNTSPSISAISHSPENPIAGEQVSIICTVIDTNGIESVTLYYRINGGSWITEDMIIVTDDIYNVTIGSFNEGYIIEYYIVASDNSPNHNILIEENGGEYYTFTVLRDISSNTTIRIQIPLVLAIVLILVRRKKKYSLFH